MDALNNAGLGARRNEDIALDLLKFVAGTVGVGRPAAPSDRIQRVRSGKTRRTREPVACALQPLPEGCGRKRVESEASGLAELVESPSPPVL